MYDENNIFAKILKKEIPCNKIYEDEHSLFFNDINPQAKIHVLGIPKTQCVDYSLIERLNIAIKGYRIITNSGKDGGQEVPHFHIHILAGEKIGSLR